jgi:hypothetical protein
MSGTKAGGSGKEIVLVSGAGISVHAENLLLSKESR